jgi:DNA-binding MarR family transcriptional regulator
MTLAECNPTGEGTAPQEAASALQATLGRLYRRLRQTRITSDLSMPESSALSRLDREGPISAAQLSKLERITPQAMGSTLAGLAERGLLERAPDPSDGRRTILTLTPAGGEAVHSKRSARTEQLAGALARLTPSERETLVGVLPLLDRLAQEL